VSLLTASQRSRTGVEEIQTAPVATAALRDAREASGHQSDRYIWRYVKPDQQTLAEAIDELE
jgi:hypothetical protein